MPPPVILLARLHAPHLVERLLRAAKNGDAATVRTLAHDLLAEHASDEASKRLAAGALMWCGDFAAALPNLGPQDHVLRARAHAHMDQFDEAKTEIESALRASGWLFGDPDPVAQCEARELSSLTAGAGLRTPWIKTRPHEPEIEPRRFARLRQGDWSAAVSLDLSIDRVRTEPLPLWRGQRVKHLVILTVDCGHGDFFQFARYVPLARERCSRLSLVVDQRLEAIAKRCLPVDEVVRKGQELPVLEVADAFAGLSPFTLRAALGVTYASPWQISPIEYSVPSLGWALQVGLRWASSASDEGQRSIPIGSLEPLRSLPGVVFHSLQVGMRLDPSGRLVEANQGAESLVRPHRHDLRTYDDTLSFIAALDAVVTVDSSVAHLAANIGKPVHLILADFEDWRWGTGETTPWYPTVTIYRGDVRESVNRICERLEKVARLKWGKTAA